MYYIISFLLIITAIGLAIYGSKKYNVSLALAYVIPNLAFLYYIDDAFNGVPYMRYGYFTVLFFGVLVLLFAKIFTYIYSYFTLLFLLVIIWASFYSIFNFNTENFGSIEAWSIILIALIVTILVRKSIKSIVIGMGSGYMLGIGIASLGFKSILNMGREYIMDAIYFPGLTILIFTIAGIAYQFYLTKSEKENQELSKKQVDLYFGAGSGIVAVLLILFPLFLTTTSGTTPSGITMPRLSAGKSENNLSNSIKLSGQYSKFLSGNQLGGQLLKFDGNAVNYGVFSMHIQGGIIDVQKTSGTYKIYGEGDNLTLELNFNTKTVSLKYLTTGAYNDGYSYRDVILPYILKLSKDSSGNYNIVGWEKDEDDESKETQEQNQNNQNNNSEGNSSQNIDYNRILGRYIGDFGMDNAILAIENIDVQNGTATGYIKTLGEYEDSQNLKGPFKVVNDNSDFRIALSNNYTTYDFYVDGKTVKGDAKDRNGETMYSFSLSKMENSSSNKLAGKTYYTIQDEDGYSNLRNKPNGDILKKVYDSEKFEVIGSEAKHKKVKLNDGTIGYIHESRIVTSVNYRVNLNTGVTNVNVRDNYGTENTKVMDQISYPLSLTVIKEHYLNNEKWIYIKEKNGWILSSFVQNKGLANQNNSINQKIKTNTPFYIISTKSVEEENIAQIEVKNLISRGYNADYLWIPKYKSLSGAELYSVYIGPFYSQFECERAIEEYRKVDGKSYALLVSQENKRVEIRGIGKIKVIEPNQNNQAILLQTTKYKIKIDNLGNNNYTYTAWPASSSMNETPNIVIKGGKWVKQGSGGNHSYEFTNGVYKYECLINVLGTDETPPANLFVYKNDDLILSQDAIIK